MDANLGNLSEMGKLLSVKDDVCGKLVTYFGLMNLGRMLSRLRLEKQQGVGVAQLVLSLCLFRIAGESVHALWRKRFHGLLETGKNCYYRLLGRVWMDWRKLLLRVSTRFCAIVRDKGAEDTHQPKCFIIDDTLIEKAGLKIERVSRVFDHVTRRCVLGFKLQLLAFFDGRSTIAADFSVHREKGKDRDYGLTREQRGDQYSKKRPEDSPAHERLSEADRSKLDVAIEMIRRAFSAGLAASLVLADSWYTCERLIAEVRAIGGGALHYVGLAKLGNTKYLVQGKKMAAEQLIARYGRENTHPCRKYRCQYIDLKGMLGSQPVRIFLVKYGRARNWNVLLTSDTGMGFTKAFEAYQIRWNIEVMNRETKQYLGLGAYQGRDFDGIIADCTLCYVTYDVMALEKRFTQYETIGELFRSEREDLVALTLWKRTLACLKRLLEVLAEKLGLDFEELLLEIAHDEASAKEYEVMADALVKLRQEEARTAA